MKLSNRIMAWLLQWTPEQWRAIAWMNVVWLTLLVAVIVREEITITKQAHKIQSLQKGYLR